MTRTRHRHSRCRRALLSRRHSLLDHSIPLPARRASSHPLRTLVSACLAEPHRLCLYRRHNFIYYLHKCRQKKDIAPPFGGQYLTGRPWPSLSIRLITQPCCSLRMCCRTVRTLLSRSTQLRSMNLPSRKPGRSPRTQCTLLPSLNCCCMRMKQQRT